MKHTKKGFTLIELLVVIAIIAVLSVVVILTLNPAELLRQARDSTRISDLNTVKSAISLFLADTASSTGLVGSSGSYATCYTSAVSAGGGNLGTCTVVFTAAPTATILSSTTATAAPGISGSGWIPINFTAISAGSPIGSLPVDPVNATPTIYFYRASTTATTFKLAAKMESSKYGPNGAGDVGTNDGGANAAYYEVGNSLSL